MSTQQLYFTNHWTYSPVKHCTTYVAETALAQVILAAIALTVHKSQHEQRLHIVTILAFALGELLYLCTAIAPNLPPWLRKQHFHSFHVFMKHRMTLGKAERASPSSSEGRRKQTGDLQDGLGRKTTMTPSVAGLITHVSS